MDTFDASCKNETCKLKPDRQNYPQKRPWVEFILVLILASVSLLSMMGLAVESTEARRARIVAVSRLEVIYNEIMKKHAELKDMNCQMIKAQLASYQQLSENSKNQTILLKRIANQIHVPTSEVHENLKQKPNH